MSAKYNLMRSAGGAAAIGFAAAAGRDGRRRHEWVECWGYGSGAAQDVTDNNGRKHEDDGTGCVSDAMKRRKCSAPAWGAKRTCARERVGSDCVLSGARASGAA